MITKEDYLFINVYFKASDGCKYLVIKLMDRKEKELDSELVELTNNDNYIDSFFMVDLVLDMCNTNELEFIGLVNNQKYYSFLVRRSMIASHECIEQCKSGV